MIVQYTKRNDKVIETKLLEVEKKDLKKGCQIKIPEGITEIGTRAFDLFQGKKTKLKIKMPDTVTKIKNSAFKDLVIEKIKFSKNLEEMESSAFESTIFKGDVVLPNHLKKISRGCFSECVFLKTFQLPDSVQVIEDYAFIEAKFQKKFVIPESIEKIPEGCFERASFKEGITLPSKLEKIENYAFMYADIKDVKIPNSVVSMGEAVFSSSTISNIELSKGITSIPYRSFARTKFLLNIQIPKNVKHIKSSAFIESGLTKIELKEGLQTIEGLALSQTHLEIIKFPGTIQSIGGNSFSECLHLKEVNFPNSLREIGQMAFFNCAIEEVSLPKSVDIGKNAFLHNRIRKISLSQDQFHQIKSKKNGAFNQNPLTEIKINNWKNLECIEKQVSKRKVRKIGKRGN